MTCIIGYVDKEKDIGYIASDKNGYNSTNTTEFKNKKIFKYKGTNSIELENNRYNILIGASGDYREIDLLQYYYNLFDDFVPNNSADKNNYINKEFLVKKVVPRLQNLFNKKEKSNSDILFIINSNIYCIQNDYAVLEPYEPFYSIGSAGDYAQGAVKGICLFIKENQIKEYSNKSIIKVAIEASKYYPGIGGNIDILSTK